MEGQHFRKTGKLVSLSEQNLIDCASYTSKYANHGCDGGLQEWAYDYIRDNGGIDTEASYPYRDEGPKCDRGNCTCLYRKGQVGATVKGYVKVKKESNEALTDAVASVGPVAVSLNAIGLMFYDKGNDRN